MSAADPRELLARLDAVRSPDFDTYASGRLPAHAVRCLMCEAAPCECQARGLTFGSAAYFARLDALHGRTISAAARTCSAPECPLTAQVGEHPAGVALATGDYSASCMIGVRPSPVALEALGEDGAP